MTTKITFEKMFSAIAAIADHWKLSDQDLLNSAAKKIAVVNASPWVFAGDCARFLNFARPTDRAAFLMMTLDERDAVLNPVNVDRIRCGWDESLDETDSDALNVILREMVELGLFTTYRIILTKNGVVYAA